ncbi:MAG: FG-GAP repeat protein [Anaerolineales bacterium]|nr:FG-GAP repeat protein [Anaerolineales bacterium]
MTSYLHLKPGWLLASMLALLLLLPVGATQAGFPQIAANTPTQPLPLTDLHPEAQAAISAALGQDNLTYHFQPTTAGFRVEQAGLTAQLTAEGVHLHSGADHLFLKLAAIGYGNHLQPLDPTAPQSSTNRLEYVRPGLTEWYINGPQGLEHGFTLAAPPGRRVNGQPLTLTLSAAGLATRIDVGGRGLTWLNGAGQAVLRYHGLTAIDADGNTLPAWLELNQAGMIQIRVKERDARYPLTIDPWFEAAGLTASDGAAYDEFGYSVAISGDTVVIGAYGDESSQGAIYIFTKPAGGWTSTTEVVKLTAADGAPGDQFGISVDISGDTIVVGANGDESYQGAAYVFTKPASGWADATQTAKLTASDGAAYDYFGASVAISGDTIVVGAYGDDIRQGSAYVFTEPGGGWTNATQTAKLTAGDGATNDYFGWSVDISGDTIVVGAKGDDSNRGAAYVFDQPGGGWTSTSTFTAKLTADDGAADDQLGYSVAIEDGTIVAGAFGDNLGQGSAYVFDQPGGWTTATQTAKLTASDGAAFDRFGASVAISGDSIIVGAYGHNNFQGAAYGFDRPGSGWANATETDKLTTDDGEPGDLIGHSVAISGDTVVIGVPGDNNFQGSTYDFSNENATAITLVSFTATAGESGVTLDWETATEVNSAGFNLHRATAPAGPYTKINPALIPATGTATTGAIYSYLDTAATDPGTIYYYKLEEIDLTTGSTFYGPISTTTKNARKVYYLPMIAR